MFNKITETFLKKMFIRISFLATCHMGMSKKSLGPLGPIQLANIWKIKLQKSVFAVITKISIFQLRISSSSILSQCVFSFFSQKLAVQQPSERILSFLDVFLHVHIHSAGIKRNLCCRIFQPILKRYTIYEETTIIHKRFETNSSFHVKYSITGKVQFLFFRRLYQD